jgi:hypothetical protein
LNAWQTDKPSITSLAEFGFVWRLEVSIRSSILERYFDQIVVPWTTIGFCLNKSKNKFAQLSFDLMLTINKFRSSSNKIIHQARRDELVNISGPSVSSKTEANCLKLLLKWFFSKTN